MEATMCDTPPPNAEERVTLTVMNATCDDNASPRHTSVRFYAHQPMTHSIEVPVRIRQASPRTTQVESHRSLISRCPSLRKRRDKRLLAAEFASDIYGDDEVVVIRPNTTLQDLDVELHERYRLPVEETFSEVGGMELFWKYEVFMFRPADDVARDSTEEAETTEHLVRLSEGTWEETKRKMVEADVRIEVSYFVLPARTQAEEDKLCSGLISPPLKPVASEWASNALKRSNTIPKRILSLRRSVK